MTAQIKIKLVAIAKDEAAYLPEWLYHHLRCGFDHIEVHINRTTDNSHAVLEKIAAVYPNVSVHSADWVDMAGPLAAKRIQFIIAANAIQRTRSENKYTHIAFFDIDEFFIHQEQLSIHSFLGQFSVDDVVFLEWVNDFAQTQLFSCIPECLEGNLSVLGKCILPVDAPVSEYRLHLPVFAPEHSVRLANGERLIASNSQMQALSAELSSLKKSFLYHRAHRSEKEYISLTFRQRPSSDFPYKDNRTGLPTATERFVKFQTDEHWYQEYVSGFGDFAARCSLGDDIEKGRAFVHARYEMAIEGLNDGLDKDYNTMCKIFTRVNDPRVHGAFYTFRKALIAQDPHNADLARELGKDAAKQNIDEAIEWMTLAKKLRPHGQQIIKLYERYMARKSALSGPPSDLMSNQGG